MSFVRYAFALVVVATVISARSVDVRAELIEYDDSTSNMIALTHIISNGATGWNDPTVHVGDVFGFRYHILIGIRDTSQLQSLFTEDVLDSAHLSFVVASVVGSPGALNVYGVRRDSTGQGVYAAYDDSRSYYCRSEWNGRKAALPTACPDSIRWEAPGATGASDVQPVTLASVASPAAGQRYDIDVTLWIAAVANGTDSLSNGLLLRVANEDGTGTDYMSIRSIHPFFAGTDRFILRIWRSQSASIARRAWLDTPDMVK